MINTLQLFKRYLPNTQNWSFNLLKNINDCNIYIYAREYLPTRYYSQDWHFLQASIYQKSKALNWATQKDPEQSLFNKSIVKLTSLLLKKEEKKVLNTHLKNKKIDVVHSHFANFGVEMDFWMKETDVPHVISFYGYDYEMLPYSQPKYKTYYKNLFTSAAAFITEGEHGKKILSRMGCPPDKVHVVKLGIDTSNVPFYNRIKPSGSLKLVQIASMTEKKGHIYSLKAFQKALDLNPDMSLTFAGCTPDNVQNPIRDELKSYVKNHNLSGKVKFEPFIPPENLYTYLQTFDVFIHPSCYAENMDCEGGAPVVLLDAQATGMPVISTYHCDIPDEVLHGKAGLLANEKDISTLSNHIVQFYNMDESEFSTFAKNARQHVEREYDVKKNGKRMTDIYKQIVGGNN